MSNSEKLAPMNNRPAPKRLKFSEVINTNEYKKTIQNTLNDPERVRRFVAAIVSAVSANAELQKCEHTSILAAGLLGESLNLSPSPQLGHYYMIPFKTKVRTEENGRPVYNDVLKAQFVLGYKGYIQLAIRSGLYKKLNVMEIKQGELIRFDPLTEEIECMMIEDYETREATPTIGYYAMFEYINGFRKVLYWSREKMEKHAEKYSASYSIEAHKRLLAGQVPDNEKYKYSSFWYRDFDTMAKKTMLRQLLSKWGILSIEMQQAITQDDAVLSVENNQIITAPDEPLLEQPEVNEVTAKVDLSAL